MMRLKGLLAVLAIAFILGGCSYHQRLVLVTPEEQVLERVSSDQSFNNHIAQLPTGPVVEGSNCQFVFRQTQDKIVQQKLDLFQEAIEKAGPSYNALVNATITYTNYPWNVLLGRRCLSIKGTAANYQEYYGAATNRMSMK